MIIILLEIRISYQPSRNSVFNSATQLKLCRAGSGNWMGNQQRRRRRSLLNSFFMSSSSSSSETQGQSVGSREKARRKFHGANWNVAADSIRNVFPSHRQFLRFLLGNISRYESFPCTHNLGERTTHVHYSRPDSSGQNLASDGFQSKNETGRTVELVHLSYRKFSHKMKPEV